MKISAIVAVSENGVIGKNGKLPWRTIPEDLKRFKKLTDDHAVIMGRKTWVSLPVKPLPNRRNIVVSRNENYLSSLSVFDTYDADSIEDAIKYVVSRNFKEAFFIGGEGIYREGLQHCNTVYLTRVHETVKCNPSDEVARFDISWFVNKCGGFLEEFLGKTSDGRASFYRYDRVK